MPNGLPRDDLQRYSGLAKRGELYIHYKIGNLLSLLSCSYVTNMD